MIVRAPQMDLFDRTREISRARCQNCGGHDVAATNARMDALKCRTCGDTWRIR